MKAPRHLYWVLLAGMICTASSSILVRWVSGEAAGLTVATYRTALAVLFLLPFVPNARDELRRLPKREWLALGFSGVMLGLHFVTWISSLYYTSVASSTVLVTTSPIFLALVGFFFFKEHLSRRTVIGIVLGMCGAAVLAYGDSGDRQFPQAAWGNALALMGMFTVSGYMLTGRYVRKRGLSWLAYVFPVYSGAALVILVFALVTGAKLAVSWHVVFICALMALGPQLAGHGSVNYAVKYLPPAFVSLLILTEPVLASTMAFLIWGEKPSTSALVGMGIVLFAVILAMTAEKQPSEASAA